MSDELRLKRAFQAIAKLRGRVAELEARGAEPIAIVSMACRFPGGVETPEQLWTVLEEGRHCITEVPAERWSVDQYFDPDPDAAGKTYSRWGGFVEGIQRFEPAFFGISAQEAQSVDPQERLLLETAWEVFERAGYSKAALNESSTGVYVGICGSEYQTRALATVDQIDAYSLLGTAHSAIVGRISYWLGLQGPNLPVDTACSSSLVALHLACMALREGECEQALAGGVNLLLSPEGHIYFSRLGALSPTGRCHTFSKAADGYVRAEGCGMVLLKRLSDAQRDGDPVLALVRGTAVNQDGQSNGFTAPSGPAQQGVIRQALARAGVDGDTIDYVECHGTGTPLGDPVEVQALAATYGRGRAAGAPLVVGAIKSNIGHTEGAAGIAGLIKVVLALQHQRIPKTLGAEELNPHVAWEDLPLRVATQETSWEALDRPRRAAVSSFGFSGTNAHAIVEETKPSEVSGEPLARPLLLSGRTAPALVAQAERWAEWLAAHPEAPWSVVERTAALRTHFPLRAAIAASDARQAGEALRALAAGRSHPRLTLARERARGKLAFLFSGQGSQRLGMGQALRRAEPLFHSELAAVLAVLDRHLPRALESIVYAAPGTAQARLLDQTAYTQPALFAMSVALARVFERFGIVPDFVMGHSIGELAAAHLSGVFTLEDAAKLVVARGRLMQACRWDGSMMALHAGEQEVRAALEGFKDRVSIAALNSPRQTVISGDAEAVIAVSQRLGLGARPKRLGVSHAFHSAHMDGMLDAFREIAEGCQLQPPRIPLISNLTGRVVEPQELLQPSYWVRQVREPVRFLDGIVTLRQAGVGTFLECGPDGVLSALAAECVPSAPEGPSLLPVLERDVEESLSFVRALGELHVLGYPVGWRETTPRPTRPAPLPTYPFQRERHWLDFGTVEAGEVASRRFPLAGRRVLLPSGTVLHLLSVGPAVQSYLADHLVYGHIVVPGAFFVAVLLAVAESTFPGRAVAIENLEFQQALSFADAEDKERLLIELVPEGAGFHARVATRREGELIEHVRAFVRGAEARELGGAPVSGGMSPPAGAIASSLLTWRAQLPALSSPALLVEALAKRNVEWLPRWQRLESVAAAGNRALAQLSIGGEDDAPVPGSAFDAVFGLLLATIDSAGADGSDVPFLPFALGRLIWGGAHAPVRWCAEERSAEPSGAGQLKSAAQLWSEDGRLLCRLDDFVAFRAPKDRLLKGRFGAKDDGAALRYAVRWVPVATDGNELAPGRNPGAAHPIVYWARREGEGILEAAHRLSEEALLQLQRWPDDMPLNWLLERGLATAPLLGLSRSARAERPRLDLRVVELSDAPPESELVPRALASEAECRIVGGEIYARRLVRPGKQDQALDGPIVSAQSTVLITGGLGGLGRQVARWLAQEHQLERIVLTSRQGPSASEALAAQVELTALGAQVEIVACDVADQASIHGALDLARRDSQRPLSIVIHAAGALDDGLLSSLSPARLHDVLRPKVDGALLLHQAMGTDERLVLFSSVAGLFGSAGQSGYAAASSFLDAVAEERMGSLSIAWGPWSGAGMAAQLSELDRGLLLGSGLDFLSPAQGLAVLAVALRSKASLEVAVGLDPRRLRARFQERGAPVPPLFHGLSRVTGSAPRPSAIRERVLGAAPGERERLVLDMVREQVAQILGLGAVREVKPLQPFEEAGFDSLRAVELRNRLASFTGLSLPATLVFDYPSPQALARHLLGRLEGASTVELAETAPLGGANQGEAVAIVSMACRFPGGVTTPEELWQLLDSGTDAITEVPDYRWDLGAHFDSDPEAAGKTYSRWGGFLGDVERFDAPFFGLSPREAKSIDPQERLLLETSYEALERAGLSLSELDGSSTGVYVGICGTEYHVRAMSRLDGIDAYSLLGTAHSAIVGRLSYWMGLRGPNFPIDTACSSSLVALHLACQALRSGECDRALAGGVNLLLAPEGHVYFSRLKALSPTGRCRSFSAAADGYVRGEGCGVLVLRRLADAQRDGDPILAVIRGSAVNQDGRSNGFTAPSGPAQQAVIRRALRVGHIPPESIDYVECHGTGTPLGDPIEVQALAAVLGEGRDAEHPVVVGSVKSNFGHTEGAAGIAGVMKVVLALQHRRLPKSLHAEEINPSVPWSELPVEVAREGAAWRVRGTPRRAGVSSFGFSGTNAHVILEEAPSTAPPSEVRVAHPLLVTGRDLNALRAQAGRWASWLSAAQDSAWPSVVHTAAFHRTHFESRAIVGVNEPAAAVVALRALAEGRPHREISVVRAEERGRLVFVFPGQGSQWPQMGRALLAESPAFAEAIDACARALHPFIEWSLRDVLSGAADSVDLERVDVVQPAIFAMAIGLAAVWRALGVTPGAVVGHSQGEIPAAVVAGVLTLEEGARIVAVRSQLLGKLPGRGGMGVVGLPLAEVVARISRDGSALSVAVVNNQGSTVVAGEAEELERFLGRLDAEGVFARRVSVDYASHSAEVDPVLPPLREALSGLRPQVGEVPFYSTVSGALQSGEALTAEYWGQNLREPVRFDRALDALLADGHNVFVELSAHPVLAMPLSEAAAEHRGVVVGSLRRDEGSLLEIYRALGQLYASGASVPWVPSEEPTTPSLAPLPTYPFQRQRHWIDAERSEVDLESSGLSPLNHALLVAWTSLGAGEGSLFSGRVSVGEQRWLGDHRVFGRVIVPGTGILELVQTAASTLGAAAIKELTLGAPLVVEPGAARRIQVSVGPANGEGLSAFTLRSSPSAEQRWSTHASGFIAAGLADPSPEFESISGWPPPEATRVDLTEFYARFGAGKLALGPAFRGLVEAYEQGGVTFGRVVLPEDVSIERYGLHPALLDAALHTLAAGLFGASLGDGAVVRLPFDWSNTALFATEARELRVRAELLEVPDADGMRASFLMADGVGRPVLSVGELRFRAAREEQLAEERELYRVDWQAREVGAPGSNGAQVVLGGDGALAILLGCPHVREIDALSALTGLERVIVDAAGDPSLDPVADSKGLVHEALLLLPRLLAQGRPELIWVTSGDDLRSAPLRGLVRSARAEYPERRLRVVAAEEIKDDALGRALDLREEDEIVLRRGEVLVPRLVRVSATAPARAPLDPAQAVLITGASGALGSALARHLVLGHGVRALVLCARRLDVSAPSVEALRDLGASVKVVAQDIAEGSAAAALLAAIADGPPLGAVFHLAGVLDDALLGTMSGEQLERALRPKIDGAWNLHQLCQGRDLRAFVMFSSVAGCLGAAGQGNYAAANSFLDALAEHRRALGLPAQSLAFGPWAQQDAGMTAHLGAADHARIRQLGLRMMSSTQGFELLDAALLRPEATLVPALLDRPALDRRMEAGGPALFRALVKPRLRQAALSSQTGTLREELVRLPESERLSVLIERVRAEAAGVLGLADVQAVLKDQPLKGLGLDSLMAVELRNRLAAKAEIFLPATLAFDHPTPEAIAAELLRRAFSEAEPQALSSPARRANSDEPIAIVGLACRFPGASDPEAYWRLLREGRDAITPFPDRWDTDALYHPDPDARGKTYSKEGGFLSDIDRFDAEFFSIAPREASAMDPQQRLLLEVAWEALERSGLRPEDLAGSPTGVYVGSAGSDYWLQDGTLESLDGYRLTGSFGSVLAGRVSYALGLNGPAMTVDTACSSSLVALHLASSALRQGECSVALAGGVQLMVTPTGFVEFSRMRASAKDGRSKSFAADADGAGWSEGVGLLVLMRLTEAVRRGQRVLATIRGSALNQDGKSQGLTAPNGPAQEAVIRQALAGAQLSPGQIDYIEAHGTGTPLGDPIEAGALAAVFGGDRQPGRPLWLGSAKSNIGHAQAAAGVAGVIKVVLALEHQELPRSLHASVPSPLVDWERSGLSLLQASKPWAPTLGRPRRAGVSSFGISGTNAHLIIEEARSDAMAPAGGSASRCAAVTPLLISGRDERALRAQAGRWAAWLAAEPQVDLVNVLTTAAAWRTHFEARALVEVEGRAELIASLTALATGQPDRHLSLGLRGDRGKTAFLFTGQGSQRAAMGRVLYQNLPVYRQTVDRLVVAFEPHLGRPLLPLLLADEGSAEALLLDDTIHQQPALFVLEVALFRLLASLGVVPELLLGHSIGELAAAHVAGVMSLADAVLLVSTRARAMQAATTGGAMISVEASEAEALAVLEGEAIDLAAINGPQQVVLSGDWAAVDRVARIFAARGRRTRALLVSHAFHSRHMDSALDELRRAAERCNFAPPTIPIISAVLGRRATAEELCSAEYWARQLRAPVRFLDGVRALCAEGATFMVECGPAPVLAALGQDCTPSEAGPIRFVSALGRGPDELGALSAALGELHLAGRSVDWGAWLGPLRATRWVDLPTYAFRPDRHWLDKASSAEAPGWLYAERWRRSALAPGARLSGLWLLVGETRADALAPLLVAAGAEVLRWPGATDRAAVAAWLRDLGRPLAGVVSLNALSAAIAPAGGFIPPITGPDLLSAAIAPAGGFIPPITGPDLLSAAIAPAGGFIPPITGPDSLSAAIAPAGGFIPPTTGPDLLSAAIAPAGGPDPLETERDEVLAELPPGLRALLALIQGLGDAAVEAPLWIFTQGAVSTGASDRASAPLQALAWGLGRVVSLEHPRRFGGLLDLPAVLDSTLADVLGATLAARDFEDQVALRGGQRFVRRLLRVAAEADQSTPIAGTVLITGGLGSLGRQVADWLVRERGVRHLVLCSRRGAQDGDAQWRAQLEAQGATVEIVAADVTQLEQVRGLVEDLEPPLSGVFHLSGVLEDALLADLKPEGLARVVAPKLDGAWNLHRLTESMALEFFVLFSSVSSLIGSRGHASYAAANAGLDALALHRRQLGLPGTSIAWSHWGVGGLVDEERAAFLLRRGFSALAPDRALECLGRALCSSRPTLGVIDVDWARFAPAAAAARPRPLFSEIPEARAALAPAGAIAALSASGPPPVQPGAQALRSLLLSLPEAGRLEHLSALVGEETARILGSAEPQGLDRGRGFAELGFDSLMSVELKKRIEARTGLSVPATLAFDHPSVDQASRWVLGQLLPDATSIVGGEAGRVKVPRDEPIAIIGIGLRMPGGATDLDSLWELLAEGRDTLQAIPRDRFDMDAVYDEDPEARGKSYVRHAALLDDVGGFDAAFFGISPREAEPMDPQHRLLLETGWSALEDAGLAPDRLKASATGVFVGIGPNEYAQNEGRAPLGDDAYDATANHTSFAAGRLAYHLGLQGPAFSVDTACSSSLVALHLAAQSLRNGECSLALAAGVQVIATARIFAMLSRTRAIAPDGRSKTFSATADGFGRGEGVVVVALERLSDARRARRRVLGVLRGSAVNHDGASSGITAPSGAAQQRVFRAALADAGLAPGQVDFIECHGTGTALGDPIEVQSVAAVYGADRGPSPLKIGTIKTNVGHLESAAGLAGVAKVLAAFRRRALPATLHSSPLNPHLDWPSLGVSVVVALTPWSSSQASAPLRAAVSAFGLSGTNAHAILEQAEPVLASAGPDGVALPLILSAKTHSALRAQAGRWRSWLAAHPEAPWRDVLYTAATGRAHLEVRAALYVANALEAEDALAALCEGRLHPAVHTGQRALGGKLGALFTGQGSQRLGMGRELYRLHPEFRRALDEVCKALDRHLERPLLSVMFAEGGSEEAGLLDETSWTQPALFALEAALFRLGHSWGLRPSVLLGHSVGELVAAYCADVMSLEDAAKLVCARGRLMQACERGGAMISLAATEAEVHRELAEQGARVEVAAVNGPSQVVISGDAEPVLAIARRFEDGGRKATRLVVSHAFHSPHMDAMQAELEGVAASCQLRPPRFMIISDVTGRVATTEELTSASYWARQARAPVRFYDGIRTAEALGVTTYLESGPQGILSALGAACSTSEGDSVFVPSLRRSCGDETAVARTLGELYVAGQSLDWPSIFAPTGGALVELPTYAFERKRHWREIRGEARSERWAGCRYMLRWDLAEGRPGVVPPGRWGLWSVPGQEDAARALKERLHQAGFVLEISLDPLNAGELDGLLCLWGGSPESAQQLSAAALKQLQGASAKTRRVWITERAVGTSAGDHVDGVGASPLWGLARSARSEAVPGAPELLDVDDSQDAAAILWAISLGDEPERAVRDGQVYVPRLAPQGGAIPGMPMIAGEGAILVTGGLGSLGREVLRWLARGGARRLVTLSRRGSEAPGATELVADLAKQGAQLVILQGDVVDASSVARALAEEPTIRGVMHVAGVVDDATIANLSPASLAAVMAPKVDGAWNLHRLTSSLDFFVLFSSIAGVLGSPGQANYAAGNSYLDSLAYYRRCRGLPAVSVAFGAWAGAGMAAALDARKRARLELRGLVALSPEDGLSLLGAAMRSAEPSTMAFGLDQARLEAGLEGSVPALYRSLIQTPPAAARGLLKEKLGAAPLEQRELLLVETLQGEIARILGLGSRSDVSPTRAFRELGMDSLVAVELRNRVAALSGLSLPATLAFDYPHVQALSRFLLGRLELAAPPGASLSDEALRALLQALPLEKLRASGLVPALLHLEAPEAPAGVTTFDDLDDASLASKALELINFSGGDDG